MSSPLCSRYGQYLRRHDPSHTGRSEVRTQATKESNKKARIRCSAQPNIDKHTSSRSPSFSHLSSVLHILPLKVAIAMASLLERMDIVPTGRGGGPVRNRGGRAGAATPYVRLFFFSRRRVCRAQRQSPLSFPPPTINYPLCLPLQHHFTSLMMRIEMNG